MKRRIVVTQKDIDEGMTGSYHCAVAVATKRAFPGVHAASCNGSVVTVYPTKDHVHPGFRAGRLIAKLPNRGSLWVEEYDLHKVNKRRKPKPTHFDLEFKRVGT